MIIKLIGIATVFISSSAMGFAFGERFAAREKELRNLADGVELMLGELTYTLLPVAEIIGRVCPNVKGVCAEMFTAMTHHINNNLSPPEAWKKALLQNASAMCLTDADKNMLLSGAFLLSAYEVTEQQNHFAELKSRINRLVLQAEQSKTKNTGVVRMLGVYGGALACVLMF